MSSENNLAYAVKQTEIDYKAEDLIMLQAQLINRNDKGHVLVEKVAADSGTYSAGKYYIPGVAMKFGEHPEEAGHRILTEELKFCTVNCCTSELKLAIIILVKPSFFRAKPVIFRGLLEEVLII